MIALWLAWALAQEPAPEAPPPVVEDPAVEDAAVAEEAGEPSAEAGAAAEGTVDEDGYEEVIVYSELMVRRARQEVIDRAKMEGYTDEIRRDGRTVMRHVDPWKGELVLHDDGTVVLKRQPVQFEPPFKKKTPLTWLSCVIVPLCVRPGGQLVSKRRYQQWEANALMSVQPEVVDWHERLSDHGTQVKIDDLPERLEELWAEGRPLDPGPSLVTFEERKQALLAYWDSRTDTEWGDRVRASVESFLRAVVQTSEHPITVAEIRAFEQSQRSTRVLGVPGAAASP